MMNSWLVGSLQRNQGVKFSEGAGRVRAVPRMTQVRPKFRNLGSCVFLALPPKCLHRPCLVTHIDWEERAVFFFFSGTSATSCQLLPGQAQAEREIKREQRISPRGTRLCSSRQKSCTAEKIFEWTAFSTAP